MKRLNWILLLSFTGLGVLAAAYTAINHQRHSRLNDNTAFFSGLAEAQSRITQIRIEGQQDQTLLIKHEGIWVIENKDGYPARQDGVLDAINQMGQSKRLEEKSSEPRYFNRMGLQPLVEHNRVGKQLNITGPDRQWNALIGEVVVGRGYYAKADQDQAAWLISGRLNLPSNSIRWLDPDVFEQPGTLIQSVKVDDLFTLSRSQESEPFQLVDKVGQKRLRNSTSRNLIARALESVVFEDVKKIEVSATPDRTLTYRQFDGTKTQVRVYKDDTNYWINLRFSAEPETDSNKAKITQLNEKHAGWLYQIPNYQAQALMLPIEALIEKGSDIAAH